MTKLQQELIDTLLNTRNVTKALFNGDFLNCQVDITSGRKTKKQRYSLVFDDPETLEGPRVVFSQCKGAYSDGFARDAFFESLRIGQGNDAALQFATKCRECGTKTGAPQWWIEAHEAQLAAVVCN